MQKITQLEIPFWGTIAILENPAQQSSSFFEENKVAIIAIGVFTLSASIGLYLRSQNNSLSDAAKEHQENWLQNDLKRIQNLLALNQGDWHVLHEKELESN